MIHQYRNNGYNIVMDVYSGSVHVVDDVCYDVIAKLNGSDRIIALQVSFIRKNDA